ncbi:MAG: roadblock/LC7 domain-containing protein [candidate division KSB1 bacterium]|nr:roadblock/LC7 domain-containing protein [candidate division KSB1 bacterium]MDZ7275798.1 roadblock/LC7 domain-containing protein [candidate division KSB1 bacterium]MDZ7287550.1 roadblock/LC7 domain-containing protein [candidate division KSB1 bacterium]MDZ7308046.1 roadblock/LC7 domain-containing protein [candidate division KSB1 bacterium]MDZ7350528.1 roadblock/LC7 domain-containing protein [candidate division KSB1 bacterium]
MSQVWAQKLIDDTLEKLCEDGFGIEGLGVFSKQGRLVAHNFGDPKVTDEQAEVIAALLLFAKHAKEALRIGTLEELHIEGKKRSLLLYDMQNGVLAVMVGREANIGLVNLETRQAIKQIDEWLSLPA